MQRESTSHSAEQAAEGRGHAMLGGWFQKTLQIKAKGRGCFLITDEVKRQLGSDLAKFQVGIAHLFIQHTSASLTLNENWDSDVRLDMEDALNRLVPEEAPYRHTAEGSDDMPAHVKSSLFGASVSIPITNGSFNLGTWQGIWLCEHRDRPSTRNIVVTLQGQPKAA
ncbi:UPF0047 protein YjbQ [Balamuthia mandrillaris]